MYNQTAATIDLHAHTTSSDGSLSPTQLVELAVDSGLTALAVTDHDTVAGLPEAISAATERGLELVVGVELSVEDEVGRYHMLGYGFDPTDAILTSTLVDLRKVRLERNELILQRAQELGFGLTWDDIRKHAGDDGEVIARPHFAAALIEKGIVSTVQEAFDKYLTPGKPLFFRKSGLSSVDAIRLLHNAGGVAVMAHPGLSKWADPISLERRLLALRDDAGLDGVEAYYNKHSAEQTHAYLAIAARLDLIVTGGSDFHGTPKPTVRLGDVYQGHPTPNTVLEVLKTAIARVRNR
ncbi:MAG TPA: PHP domain-containing protein [Capsulimonadaceae bacterium]|jgi:hypothetical protein